jgi:hypothetical protein
MLGGKYWSVFKDNGLATYNPQLLTLTIADQVVNGFGDNVCTISYSSDNIIPVKGIDGNTALLRQSNRDAILTFSLLQMSETNKWLLQMQADMLDDTKPIQLPNATFTDYNLLVSWSAESVFIQKHPDMSYNASTESVVWQLYCLGMTPRQNIKLDDSILTNEQILFRKVGAAVKSAGKTISGIFS